ncbi:MAG: ABC transporter ATP-binding protein [Oligoflexia bacterium]|nr:ABC transporter ATP-binding protein [Oligoflexia bacterium]
MQQEHLSLSIKAHDLIAAYDNIIALRVPELSIRGNIIAIIGHNGAGKSTFIKTQLGLHPCQQGYLRSSILEDDSELLLDPALHMAFCPEVGSVFADISVESYVKLWCRIKQGDPDYYRTKGSRYIEALQLTPLLSRKGRELSKGQRRRVQTAIGFLMHPKLFLFDEPFDGLDVQRTSELADMIREESVNMSFMISSHRMDVVERLADRLIVLKEGAIFAQGSLDEVCRKLAGNSVHIHGSYEQQQLADALARAFPNCLVTRIGPSLTLTGHTAESAKVREFLSHSKLTSLSLDESLPTLVDSMDVHLRGL